ncbi:MAG: hypothetical protein JWO78_916 [Micavibrio sp.]|nr:hypothetical protein [Micavibrio sp.]
MSITSYFREKAEARTIKAQAKTLFEKLQTGIKKGELEQVTNLLNWAPVNVIKVIPEVGESLPVMALEAGRADIFEAVLNTLANGDPNGFYSTEERETLRDNNVAIRATQKTYLHYAMQQGKPDIAMFLASHPKLDPDQASFQSFRGETTWQESSIEMARSSGMIQVVITLAERLADKRRDQGHSYLTKMLAEADGFTNEAAQFRKLDLPNGVYKLPALNQS